MKLTALTPDLLRRVIAIYQDLAYGKGRRARAIELPAGPGAEAALSLFHREQVETIPGHPCERYTLRLGNRNYPRALITCPSLQDGRSSQVTADHGHGPLSG